MRERLPPDALGGPLFISGVHAFAGSVSACGGRWVARSAAMPAGAESSVWVTATQTEVAKVSPAEAAGAREGEHEVEWRCLMKDDADGHSRQAEGREGQG